MRILHTADTHLGYQQYHLPERREDFLDAFRQVAADAEDAGVDAVVHAGDLFHDRRPTLPDIMGALSVLRRLDGAGIPFFAVVGNHESRRSAQWLDLFESMGLATRLGTEPVVLDGVALYGLDFVPRSKRDDLAYEFAEHDADTAVLVSHGLFEPFDHGDWDARRLLRESSVRFDALLLGDDHTPGTLRVEKPHEAWLTYPGSTERASAAEREERGYNLVGFEDGIDIRRRGLDTREFVFVDVELGEGEGTQRVRERVGQHDVADAVVVVDISGEGDPVMPAAVEEFVAEKGALVARVTDNRETADDGEVEVSFADPDDAVAERVGEMGLSPAARGIDETVRASKVADANVADTVERRVAELVEEDPGAFSPAESGDGDRDGSDEASEPEGKTDAAGETQAGTESESGRTAGEDQVTMEDYL